MIDLNSFFTIFDISLKIASIIALIVVFQKSLVLYYIKNQRNDKTRIFITLQIFFMISFSSGLASYVSIAFFENPSIIALVIIQTIWVLNIIIATVYNIEFTYRVLSFHPSQKFIRVLYIFIGILIGWGRCPFSTYERMNSTQIPDLIIFPMLILIFLTLIAITINAYVSQRKQSILLVKRRMIYYTYAYAIPHIFLFYINTFNSFGISSFENNLLLDLMSFMQIISIIICYIAFFQPLWFKRRYEKERFYIEKLFDKVRLSK